MKVLNPYVRSRDIASSFAQTPAAGSNITRRQRSTDASQLRAFTGARREDVRTGPDDAVANMSVSRRATHGLGNRGENLTAAALPCCATAADESRGND